MPDSYDWSHVFILCPYTTRNIETYETYELSRNENMNCAKLRFFYIILITPPNNTFVENNIST